MEDEDKSISKVRGAQVGAASIGTILVYLAKLDSVDPVLGQIIIYATPFLTIASATGLVLIEDYCRSVIVKRKAKKDLEDYLKYCEDHLEDESLDEDFRRDILAKRNLVKKAAFHNNYHHVLKNFPDGSKTDNAKKSNRRPKPPTGS